MSVVSFLLTAAALAGQPPVLPQARAATNALGKPAPPSSARTDSNKTAAAERHIQLNIALLINGSPSGEVTVDTTTSGNASVDFKGLMAALRPIVTQATADDLTRRAAGRALVPLGDLTSPALPIVFDMATLQLRVDLPINAKATGTISIAGERTNPAQITPPEDFSTGVTFSINDRINQVRNFGDLDRDPLTVAARGFVNWGGIDGVNLAFQTGYREGEYPVRQMTTLFHDDVTHAIRYSLGDITPQSFGAYSAPVGMIGIGAERLYQEIQPYRNLRPSGRGGLTIERPSHVDILVNGALYRTIDLAPGNYNLRDFPFLDGLNDVQLVVRDDTGREETINLSFFSDVDLLQPGLSVFSANFGFEQNRFGEFEETGYRRTPSFSGFYQRGITDRLTLGAGAQWDRHNGLISGEAVVATSLGVFGLQAAGDFNSVDPAQWAALASWRLSSSTQSGAQRSFDLDIEYESAFFSPMTPIGTDRNRYSLDITARVQTPLWHDAYGTLGGTYGMGRRGYRDEVTASVGVTQRIGRLNLSANYVYTKDAPRSDHRVMLSISLPFSSNQYARTAYDSDLNRVSADYDLIGLEGLNQTSAQVSLARDDTGQTAQVDVTHYGNRFQASLDHSYQHVDGQTSEYTDLGAAFGIGYAGGKVALGRDADRGFTIVAAHPTLRDAQITAYDNYTLGASARTGAFGPALVPTQRGYQPDAIKVTVDKLPPGYDIGAGRIDILPGAASGYVFEVGSAASNTVIGHIVAADGKPAVYVAGTLQPISGKDAKPVPFFTNRTGRMVAQKVAPGRYRVMLNGASAPLGEITVPTNPKGPVDIGMLRMKQ